MRPHRALLGMSSSTQAAICVHPAYLNRTGPARGFTCLRCHICQTADVVGVKGSSDRNGSLAQQLTISGFFARRHAVLEQLREDARFAREFVFAWGSCSLEFLETARRPPRGCSPGAGKTRSLEPKRARGDDVAQIGIRKLCFAKRPLTCQDPGSFS